MAESLTKKFKVNFSKSVVRQNLLTPITNICHFVVQKCSLRRQSFGHRQQRKHRAMSFFPHESQDSVVQFFVHVIIMCFGFGNDYVGQEARS